MFWLFKRKKVADKRAITPCVCDNGNQLQDSYTLQDFGGPSESTSKLAALNSPRNSGTRKGYRRLEGAQEESDEIPQEVLNLQVANNDTATVPPPPPPAQTEDNCGTSSSTESSDDYDKEYFGGFTDTDEEEEELTCNVCERSFHSVRRLEQHQQRLRHYGCSVCDSIFPTLMALELHKETLDHWSDYELKVRQIQEDSEAESEDELEEHRVYSRRGRDELKRLLL